MTRKQTAASFVWLACLVGGLILLALKGKAEARSSSAYTVSLQGVLPRLEKEQPGSLSFGFGGGSPKLPSANEPQTQRAVNELRQECESVSVGEVAFAPEQNMVEGNASQVFVRVSRGGGPALIRDWPTKQLEAVVVERLALTCIVRATLVSASGDFDIQPSAEVARERYLRADDAEEWSWIVTPLKRGKLRLTLIIQPELAVAGFGPTATAVKNLTRTIDVETSYKYTAKRYAGLGFTLFSGTALAGTLLPAAWSWCKTKFNTRAKNEPWAMP